MVSDSRKDPRKVAAGRAGMRARWGEPRRLRLDSLDPITRRAILAIVAAAAENKKAPVVSETPTEATLPEDHDDGHPEAA